ncbi:MAG: hypothetical protein A2878_00140 [Candidatus Moranbacteria bacterium RIFCSPHIGHO2_01_FULL_54_31]|nr:MAG: hypothetical protein A2878_00140 [Candidatus Moranbacteria bacterium RIFCSPHIGHO2_01_FULL_54_31]
MFGKTDINKRIYYPLLAAENLSGGVNSQEEIADIWNRFDALPEERKNILTSVEVAEKMKLLQDTFGCDDASVEGISVLVRWLFFGQIDWHGFQGGIQDICDEFSPEKTPAVVSFIQKEILTLKPAPRVEETYEEAKPRALTVSLPILQALSKYEGLGNQLITQERIRTKTQTEPVRPSLLYWLKYYRDELGIGQHNSVERGEFLFRSENGRKLSAEERERINLILKSVEENFPLTIDTERQEIVFPVFQGVLMGASKAPAAFPSNAQMMKGPTFADGGAKMTERTTERAEERPAYAEQRPPLSPAPNPNDSGGLRIGRGTSFNVARFDEEQARRAPEKKTAAPEAGGISFSASHIFPAEREVAEQAAAPQTEMPQAPPAQPARTAPAPEPQARPRSSALSQPNPFHIRPMSSGRKD